MKPTPNSKQIQNRRQAAKAPEVKPFSRWTLLPLMLAIAVVPLITIVHTYDCGLEKYPWFSQGGLVYDFFLYYKSFFLHLIGILILIMLAYLVPCRDHEFLTEKRSLPPVIAIGIFGLFTLASSLMADDTKSAFFGGYEQFEGCFVLLTYVGCFFLAFGYARTIRLIRFLLDVLLIGATIVGLLGFFQSIGFDWVRSDWAKPILGMEMDLSGFNIQLNFGEGVSYATLYNPDYVGSYVALVLPYCLYLILRGEKIWRRILAFVCAGLLIKTLLGSGSRTGIIGLVVGTMICVILIFPYMKKVKRIIAIAAGVVAIAGMAYIVYSQDILTWIFVTPDSFAIDTMLFDDTSVKLHTENDLDIVATLDPEKLTDPRWGENYAIQDLITVTDGKGNPIATTPNEEGQLTLTQEGYPPFYFFRTVKQLTDDQGNVTDEMSLLHVVDPGYEWYMTWRDGKLQLLNDFGRLDNLRKIKKFGFKGKYWFAHRRGFIWSRTLPLLPETLLVGKGPDNFIYAFPNDDYLTKRYMAYNQMNVTKPHNLILQMWVQDGGIATLAFLFLWVLFIVRAFRLCFGKNKVKPDKGISLHSFVIITATATTAYMTVGFANDSTITVAPIFWVMLGAGYAAEAVCRKENPIPAIEKAPENEPEPAEKKENRKKTK